MVFDILYQDEYIVVVNKPPGIPVHRSKMVADAKEFVLQNLRDQLQKKVFPVHRLDRKTSGALIFALDSETNAALGKQFQEGQVSKIYRAIVRGYLLDSDIIDYPLTNDKGVTQEAVTHFQEIQRTEIDIPLGKHDTSRYTYVELRPKTGRFHQLRKHMNHLRHPILGDRPHGCSKQNRLWKQRFNLEEMMLHARQITFMHPHTQQEITISAPFFSEFKRVAEILSFEL